MYFSLKKLHVKYVLCEDWRVLGSLCQHKKNLLLQMMVSFCS